MRTGTRVLLLVVGVSLGMASVRSAAPPLLAESPRHNVMLRVVHVTPDWHPFNITHGGWPSAAPLKESESLKFFEAAIWEETRSIHLYEFDNAFDHSGRSAVRTPEEMTELREGYAVLRVAEMPSRHTPARSRFVRDAFEMFASYLNGRFPDSEHHLMYNGHGGPGGRLLGGELSPSDASAFLAHWSAALGRRLGVIDMGGPCNKGSFADLENFCQYTRFYVASDLPNGGFTMDDWTVEKFLETSPERQYHRLFAESLTLEQVLSRRVDLRRRHYEYSRENMTAAGVRQGNYLYSCAAFARFAMAFRTFVEEKGNAFSPYGDLYDYLVENGAGVEMLKGFGAVFVRRAENRDFFEWGPGANGMLLPGELLPRRSLLTASFEAPSRSRAGVPVVFDGSGSTGVESFRWDFGDGSVISHPSRESGATHAYVEPGSYAVRLEVARGGGCGERFCQYDSATIVVEVDAINAAGPCEPDEDTLCLRDRRFEVGVEWWTGDGEAGPAQIVPEATDDSGLFRFFDADNWEILIKVLDGCAVNDHYWVFGASTTNLGYVIRVTDRTTGDAREYRNEPGQSAAAITDAKAFPDACRP